jgi:hypothetical protein
MERWWQTLERTIVHREDIGMFVAQYNRCWPHDGLFEQVGRVMTPGNSGILEFWNSGILEFWNSGILDRNGMRWTGRNWEEITTNQVGGEGQIPTRNTQFL